MGQGLLAKLCALSKLYLKCIRGENLGLCKVYNVANGGETLFEEGV